MATPKFVNGRKCFTAVPILFAALLSGAASSATAGPASRIKERVADGNRFTLTGNTHPRIASATDQGEVQASQVVPLISIHFQMTQAQQTDLKNLLDAQQQRTSPQYHKWLTPEAFADRFGLNDSDISKVTAWLSAAGFTDIQVARSRNSISMSGTAGLVQSALGSSIHNYRMADGSVHFANAADPALPQALQGIVASVRGLTDIRPKARRIRPRFTSGITGNHFIAPGDFATIYDVQALYNSGIDGTGQTIAIPGQTDIQMSDIEAFQTASGLTVKDPQVILDGADPGTSTDDLSEADLDIEWAGAVARGANIVYVNSQDAFTSALYAISNNVANVLSITYGGCESSIGSTEINTLNAAFQQANAQGMTVLAASGDLGAADCDEPFNPNAPAVTVARQGLAVDFPGSSPYVTDAGGTELNEGAGAYWSTTNSSTQGSAVSYIPEMGWNDGPLGTNMESDLAASGGGKSIVFTKPSWQAGTGVPNDAARDVPDIALVASPDHDGLLICSAGSCVNGYRDANQNLNEIGGTSVSAPTMAGIVALINQQMKAAQGNINSTLYALASISSNAFHDVTVGNNTVTCRVGTPNCTSATVGATTSTFGYTAGTGYDQVTGLGSIDAFNLVNEWGSYFTISANPTSLTVSPGGSGTATVTVSSFGQFGGTVSFTCTVPATLPNTTCSIPGTVTKSGTATLTIKDTGTTSTYPFRRFSYPSGPMLWFSLLLAMGTGVTMLLFPRRQARMGWGGIALTSLVFMTACGGGSGSSSSGSGSSTTQTVTTVTGTVTVTATSGVLTSATTITVTD